MQLKINLATRTYVDTGKANGALAIACFFLFLGLFFSIKAIATNAGEMKLVQQNVATLEQKEKGKVGEKEYQALLARIGAANTIIARKSYNWLQLLDRLETVVPDGVAMTSIQPDPKGRELKLAGVARNFADMRRFMENLEETQFFTDVYLLSNSESKVGASQKGMSFTITCKVSGK